MYYSYRSAMALVFLAHPSLHTSLRKNCARFSDSITQSLGIDQIPVQADAYLLFKRAARLKGIEVCMPQDEFSHIYRLERMFKASDIIKNRTGFIRGNSSAAIVHHRLASSLLTAPDAPSAIERWRRVDAESGADQKWQEYQAVSEASSADIVAMHSAIQASDAVSEHVVLPELAVRIYGPSAGSHRACDDRQLAQKPHPTRTLDYSAKHGLKVEIPAHKFSQIQEVAHMSTPLIENLKNRRFLTISGLRNSKVSLLVHDHFDHAVTFKLLRDAGIMKRYEHFLSQVGNPQNCDILSREGELIASISYDYRFTSYPRFNQLSLVSYDDIVKMLRANPSLSPNQSSALAICQERLNDPEFTKRLPVVVSGVYTEMMQQRVKNGVIKTVQGNKQVDALRLTDPEYLALIVETLDCMYKNRPHVKKQLLNTQLMVEDVLHQALEADGMDLVITVSGQTVDEFTRPSRVPEHRARWIENNLGAISDRNPVIG